MVGGGGVKRREEEVGKVIELEMEFVKVSFYDGKSRVRGEKDKNF